MQQKELKELNEEGKLTAVVAIDRGSYWNVIAATVDEETTIRSARGGQREFKTLDAVKKMLAEVGITKFCVSPVVDF